MAHHIACLYRRPVGRRGGYGLRIVRCEAVGGGRFTAGVAGA